MDEKKIITQNENLLLRAPTHEDCNEFLKNAFDSKGMHRPWIFAPNDKVEFLDYIESCNSETMIGLLVLKKPEHEFIGVININEIVRKAFQSAYLGFYGFKSMCGRGYMTEALVLAIDYFFQELKLHRLEANIQPDNKRSIRLVTRCGFKNEGFSPNYLKIGGVWKDHERWAILSSNI